jgi:hypothetical protein
MTLYAIPENQPANIVEPDRTHATITLQAAVAIFQETKDTQMYQVKTGDNKPLDLQLREGSNPVDLTGATGTFSMIQREGEDEQQTITISGSPSGGTFTLTFLDDTTDAIARNATATTVKNELEELGTIGYGDLTVTGSAGGPWVITFGGTLTATDVPTLTATSSLTGGSSPAIAVTTTNTTRKSVSRAISLVDADEGLIRVPWTSADLDTPGIYDAEITITDSGVIQTYPSTGYLAIDVIESL